MQADNDKMINEDITDNNLTIEQAFDNLKELLEKMESKELTLEENFSLYDEGLKLVKVCSDKLDMIEKKIIVLEEDNKYEA